MILSPDNARSRWQPLAGGSWLFQGERFCDARGTSDEICGFEHWPASLEPFVVAQENVVTTHRAGCARGLHYQVEPYAQAKVVTVLRGSAQFFWVPLDNDLPSARVHSIILTDNAASLYTPATCAHGMLAVADETQFLLKMSMPVSLKHRGEVNFGAKSLFIDLTHPLREDLLSPRDRSASQWKVRRRSIAR